MDTLLQTIGQGLIAISIFIVVGSGVWGYILIFRFSVGWGFACLFVPFVGLFFLTKYRHVVDRPLKYALIGFVVLIIGMLLDSTG